MDNITNKRLKIGLLGGSFNPCHHGHVHISKIAYKTLGLKKVWWVVSPQNPLKNNNVADDFGLRLTYSKTFTKNHRYINVTDIEKILAGGEPKFYTYNFLSRLVKQYPKYKFYFIIGADNLVNFHKWYKWQKLTKLVQFVVIDRGRDKYKALKSKAYSSGNFIFISSKKVNISSTEIREKLGKV